MLDQLQCLWGGEGKSRISFSGIILKEWKTGTALKCHKPFLLQSAARKKGNISAADWRIPKCTQTPADAGEGLKTRVHFYEDQL